MTEQKSLQLIEAKNITDQVYNRVLSMQSAGNLELPENYSAGNALKSAWLILQDIKDKNGKLALQVCDQSSIANALLEMVVQGLNPMKKQCYFIPYGKTLVMQRSYMGTIAITKRLPGVVDVKGYAVYKDDKLKLGFDIVTGRTKLDVFEPGLNHDPANLIGAIALIIGDKGIIHVEYMDMPQIKAAWNQGQMHGKSGAHTNFSDQMAIKTVINRACKLYANTSDDTGLISNMLQKSMDDTDRIQEAEVVENTNIIDFQDEPTPEVPENVNQETGEIINNDAEFFNENFKPLDESDAPF